MQSRHLRLVAAMRIDNLLRRVSAEPAVGGLLLEERDGVVPNGEPTGNSGCRS